MKYLLYLLAALLLNVPFYADAQEAKASANLTKKGIEKEAAASLWSRQLEVQTGEERFDDTRHHAYRVTIYDARNKEVEKLWKEEIKRNSEKLKGVRKKGVQSYMVDLPGISPEPLEVHAKAEDGVTPNSAVFSITFLKDGTPIGPETYPGLHEKAEKMMYNLSVRMNKSVVRNQLDEQMDILKDMQKDLEKLKKGKENLYGDIAKNTERLRDAEAEHIKDGQELEILNEEIADYRAVIGQGASADELKQLAKMRKDLNKKERSVSRLAEKKIEYRRKIAEAEEAIPINEQEQIAKDAEIKNQKLLVEQYRLTLADVK